MLTHIKRIGKFTHMQRARERIQWADWECVGTTA